MSNEMNEMRVLAGLEPLVEDAEDLDEAVEPIVKISRHVKLLEGYVKQLRSSTDKFAKGGEKYRPQLDNIKEFAIASMGSLKRILLQLDKEKENKAAQ